MRTTRTFSSAVLFLLATAAVVPAQNGTPAPPRNFGFDVGVIFDRMDANKDGVITRDELTDQRAISWYEDYSRRAGVTDGRLTREAFIKGYQDRMEERARESRARFGGGGFGGGRGAGFGGGGFGGGGFGGGGFGGGGFGGGGFGGGGFGFGGGSGPGSAASMTPPSKIEPAKEKEKEEAPVVVYRAGKLPSGLPSWFSELDKDGDGQIGMHEWKGKEIKEFLALDRDGDGYITIAEALRSVKGNKSSSSSTTAVASSSVKKESNSSTGSSETKLEKTTDSTAKSLGKSAELPGWLKEMDKDGDGQVGMHEWKGEISKFLALDRDGDGFITAAEATKPASGKPRDARTASTSVKTAVETK